MDPSMLAYSTPSSMLESAGKQDEVRTAAQQLILGSKYIMQACNNAMNIKLQGTEAADSWSCASAILPCQLLCCCC